MSDQRLKWPWSLFPRWMVCLVYVVLVPVIIAYRMAMQLPECWRDTVDEFIELQRMR